MKVTLLGAGAYADAMRSPYNGRPSPARITLERDGALLEDAASQSVVLATPMTLLALLRAVASGWTQLSTAKNAEAIRDAAVELCERLESMLGHFDNVGGQLKKALDAFNAFGETENTKNTPAILLIDEDQPLFAKQAHLAPHRVLMQMPIKVKEVRATLKQLLAGK